MRPRGRQQFNRPQRDMTLINERIRYPQVRVIDEDNGQLGVMTTRDAVDMARDRGYDLILVAPQAQPPVCRIMDYGKFKYEKSKRDKVAQKKGKTAASDMKMVRLHPPTSDNDRAILIRHADRFLREGHKVRVVCQFRRRENAYPEIGRKQLDTVAEALAEVSTVEGAINKQGRDMTMMLAPKPGIKPLPKIDKTKKGQEAAAEAARQAQEDAEFEALQARIAAENDQEGDPEIDALAVAQADSADPDETLDQDVAQGTDDETEAEDEAETEDADTQ